MNVPRHTQGVAPASPVRYTSAPARYTASRHVASPTRHAGPPAAASVPYAAPVKQQYMPIAKRFGLKVRDLRKRHNYTQSRLADRFGIDRSYISEIERGKKSISLSMMEILAVGFKIPLSELLRDI